MRQPGKRSRRVVPQPVKTSSRTCFGIAYFTREVDAEVFAAEVARTGQTYNGGFFHGMACGRDKGWDYVDASLGQLYAVTTR